MNLKMIFMLFFLSIYIFPGIVEAEFRPQKYICYRAPGPIIIDGKISEGAWKYAEFSGLFVDIQGDRKPLPYYATRVKMLWDDDYMYFAADMEEPDVWGNLTKKDSGICAENDFEIFIDPDGDGIDYYEFEISPLNGVLDLLLPVAFKSMWRGKTNDHSWDINGLKTAVYVDGTLNCFHDIDRGWSVEVAWPMKSLAEYAHAISVPPKNHDQWRVNFSRVEFIRDTESKELRKKPNTIPCCENWVWSSMEILEMHWPEMFGIVEFSTSIAGSSPHDINPR
jgi:hypothetical protein